MKDKYFRKLKHVSGNPQNAGFCTIYPTDSGGLSGPQTPGLHFSASLCLPFSTYFFKIASYFWKCWKPWTLTDLHVSSRCPESQNEAGSWHDYHENLSKWKSCKSRLFNTHGLWYSCIHLIILSKSTDTATLAVLSVWNIVFWFFFKLLITKFSQFAKKKIPILCRGPILK